MAKRLMSLTAPLATLAEIEAAIWSELKAALQTRGHPWRQAVLATADGEGADARTVVLREVDVQERTLVFYTDARSPKVAQIAAHPRGTLVLWAATLGWQLRLQVQLAVQSDGLSVSSRWARVSTTLAAQDYLSVLAPGSPLKTAVPERGTREHFAVLTANVLSIDWLELHADGHRRALFDARGQHWLAP